MVYRTEPFRIPRYLLARLSAEQYVRSFWWFVLVVPLFGILALFSGSAIIQAIGIFAILWPITIPARAVLGGWKAGTFFSGGVSLEVSDRTLYFHGTAGDGMKLSMDAVRKAEVRHGFLLLSFGIGEFVAIPATALATNGEGLLRALKGDDVEGPS